MDRIDAEYEILQSAVREAGRLALTFWKKNAKTWRKPDGSDVSEADIAVNDALGERLRRAAPSYGWLSEETPDDGARLGAERVWIIDPIDGTASFVTGHAQWCISAALIEAGIPILAAVYNPALDEFFAARSGRGATLNGRAIAAPDPADLEGARLLASSGAFKPKYWAQPLPPHRPLWANSIAYRLCLVACGRADATLAFTPKWEWDLAGGALIASEAGCVVSDPDGAPLKFNTPEPRLKGVIAAPPRLHAQLLARRKPDQTIIQTHPAGDPRP